MLNRRRFVGLGAAAVAAPSILFSRASGADWPVKSVRVVVPFAPGGSTDTTARLVGNRLQEVWGQSVVIENKAGAGGNIAADMVAHSDPDGYTIFIVGPGQATNQFLYPQLSYDPVGDFAPVTLLITQPNMMCVPNSSPAKSVQAFIAYCNENKGKVTYASSVWRIVQAAGEGRDDAHPVSRRRARDQRPDSRPRRRHLRQHADSAGACEGRQPARAGGDDQRARRRRARSADHCGVGLARLRRVFMVRVLRAGK